MNLRLSEQKSSKHFSFKFYLQILVKHLIKNPVQQDLLKLPKSILSSDSMVEYRVLNTRTFLQNFKYSKVRVTRSSNRAFTLQCFELYFSNLKKNSIYKIDEYYELLNFN